MVPWTHILFLFWYAIQNSSSEIQCPRNAIHFMKCGQTVSLHELKNSTLPCVTLNLENDQEISNIDLNRDAFYIRWPEKSWDIIKGTLLNLIIEENASLRKIGSNAFVNVPVCLKNIAIRNNPNLTTIEDNAFVNCKHVESLDLSSNRIQTITNNSFAGLTNLNEIDLSKNKLTLIPDETFSNLLKLKSVVLNSNSLAAIPYNCFNNNLEQLDLRQNAVNSINDIPSSEFQKLKILNLCENGLEQIPTNFLNHAVQLESLYLCQNKINVLQDHLVLVNLLELNLANNNLEHVSKEMFSRLKTIRSIFLGHNKLRHISDGTFQDFNDLFVVDLQGNFLEEIGNNSFSNQTEVILLQNNELKSINNINWPNTLSFLDLRHNKIENLDVKEINNKAPYVEVQVVTDEWDCIEQKLYKMLLRKLNIKVREKKVRCLDEHSRLKNLIKLVGMTSVEQILSS